MTREQYEGITQSAPDKLREHLGELESSVMEAASEALSASQDSDDGGKPKVRISLSVVIDLTSKTPTWHTEGKVGVTYKVRSEDEVCDETPELLPGIGMSTKPKTPKGKAIERFFDEVAKLNNDDISVTLKANEKKLKP